MLVALALYSRGVPLVACCLLCAGLVCAAAFAGMLQLWLMVSASHENGASFHALSDASNRTQCHAHEPKHTSSTVEQSLATQPFFMLFHRDLATRQAENPRERHTATRKAGPPAENNGTEIAHSKWPKPGSNRQKRQRPTGAQVGDRFRS